MPNSTLQEPDRSAVPVRSQTGTGIALAFAIGAAWLALHVHGVFFHRLTTGGLAVAPLLILLQCWLSVGLFIVAHDCMHGSLAPGRPGINAAIGRTMLLLYAGFWFDALLAKHADHHRNPGTALDPDFNADAPTRFWPWYRRFLLEYFGWSQLATIALVLTVETQVLGASLANALLFWALPAILSSLQLFAFGTYLPHRHGRGGFADDHRARSSDFSWLGSLLTCFHFGYHHEHHLRPGVPWWGLPRIRAGERLRLPQPR